MEFDIAIGIKTNCFVEPSIVFDAKVELDSARLKTALASFAILKKWNPKAKCFLIYIVKEVDTAFLELAKHWIDGIFQLNPKNDEMQAFLSCVANYFTQS
jgi:basic membrane lipoprotein Med (substrate-binding protein (PBP1-ABC) superfamily)